MLYWLLFIVILAGWMIYCRKKWDALELELADLAASKQYHQLGRILFSKAFYFNIYRATEIGFFYTFGIKSISEVLRAAGGIPKEAEKRLHDTDVLVREAIENDQAGDRAITAFQRINEIHSRYPITNQDMLFVLGTFYIPGIQWVQKYDYRPLTKAELDSVHKLWFDAGVAMGIKDIPETHEKYVEAWEERLRIDGEFHEVNRFITDKMAEPILAKLPAWIKPKAIFEALLPALIHDQLRIALGFEKAPYLLTLVLPWILKARSQFARIFMPPIEARRTPLVIGADGKYYPLWKLFGGDNFMKPGEGYDPISVGPAPAKLGVLHTATSKCPYAM